MTGEHAEARNSVAAFANDAIDVRARIFIKLRSLPRQAFEPRERGEGGGADFLVSATSRRDKVECEWRARCLLKLLLSRRPGRPVVWFVPCARHGLASHLSREGHGR